MRVSLSRLMTALTEYQTPATITTVQDFYDSKNPDNSLFVKVPAFVRLGSFLQMPFSKRWRASRDAVLLFLRAALGAYPGGNTRLSPKTGDCTGSTCMGISVTG